MRRRGMITFVILNVLISAGVAFGIISTFGEGRGEVVERQVTFVVVYTATPDPNASPVVRVITATPGPGGQARADIPTDVLEGTPVASGPVPTVDPELLDEEGRFIGDTQALPENCIQHIVGDGENPSLIAAQYDANLFELLAVNGLDEETATGLQIGDVLIVPLEGCPLDELLENQEQSAEGTEEVAAEAEGTSEAESTGEVTEEASPTPTVTLAPTAANAQLEIVEVIGAGDITREGVVIRNNGALVDISGWTLSDGEGNSYVFPEGRRLFSGAGVTVYTRDGENTAILFFWGRDAPVFGEAGDVVVLADRDGRVQASLRLANRPDESS